jgi:hypothetical protein
MSLTCRPARAVWPVLVLLVLAASGAPGRVGAQGDAGPIRESDARRWLTDLSSDVMQGRRTFTEGYGLASAYVAGELRQIGIEPLGHDGSYFQPVARRGYTVSQQSRVVVTARGETRTFAHGDHVTFALQSGGKQTLTFKTIEFAGYGLGRVGDNDSRAQAARFDESLVIFLPGNPQGLPSSALPRGLVTQTGRASALVRAPNVAAAAIGLQVPTAGRRGGGPAQEPAAAGGRGGRGGGAVRADVTTTAQVDRLVAPALTADEEFFAFVLGEAEGGLAALKAKAEKGEPLPHFTVPGVEVSVQIDARYEVVSTERTQNVVAIVRGSDPVLRDEYVLFGAHLDHVGYATGTQAQGRANTPVAEDPIWNGADDDGSGSTAVIAIAKAFAAGPRPKRSAIFVWHAGEESGLIGSLYMAENPVVPLEKIQAVFNIDMIGRNRDDDPGQSNTVFSIGADRISTDLHNVIEDVNLRLSRPLTLDYEYNDPADTNSFYTRSDHYSYAAKGVPVAFFFTGTHPDYHANTDTVDKILFPKLVRIAEFIYRAGYAVADRATPLRRDNLGPRAGRGFLGRLPE